KEVVVSLNQALDVIHPSIHCHDSIMTPIDGGAEIRDFIAALETAPEVMASAVGVVVLGFVVVLLLLFSAVTSGGVVFLPSLLFGPPRPIIIVVTTGGAP